MLTLTLAMGAEQELVILFLTDAARARKRTARAFRK